ncbi:MAG: thiamine pyrophosphate-binding protein [Thiomicrospira sp.]|nr:MAG: thiamine pyrophosphate-binding protein [Thiomicrospira sp.]
MSKVRLADYVADFVFKTLKVNDIFTVTGGGAMFLNDAFGNHEKLNAIYNHHEQASAMAAVGYAKYSEGFGAACVTTGCGGTNAVTGVLDAWQDSTPVFFVSGQVKRKETTYNSPVQMRQYGVQEADVVAIVDSITKYSVMVNEPEEIAYHLEKAAFLANNGRPGPVWIDIPLDVQGAWIETSELKHFNPESEGFDFPKSPEPDSLKQLEVLLREAKRPIVIAGNGVRLSNTKKAFQEFVQKHHLPVTFSYLSIDLLPSNHPLAVGRLGAKGDRAGNFAVQNSDLVIVLGSRLSVALTGFEYDLFAREAKVIVVDIDAEEHKKNTVNIDLMIESDLRDFFSVADVSSRGSDEWVQKCRYWREKWPVYQDSYASEKNINMYEFIHGLEKVMKDDSVVVSDAGSAYYVTSQALKINANQRYVTSGAQADMGYTLPAAIGACVAHNSQEVFAITGDGSFQMNIQELQTIFHNQLPIKIFVWNNNGYLSIKTTQSKFFDSRYAGTGPQSGVSCPEFKKIAYAYDIPFFKAETPSQLSKVLEDVLTEKGPVICEIVCPESQEVIPAVSSMKKEDGTMVSKPIEDMYPFLDREEFLSEMIVSPVKE